MKLGATRGIRLIFAFTVLMFFPIGMATSTVAPPLQIEKQVELQSGTDFLRQCAPVVRISDGDKDVSVEDSLKGLVCSGYMQGFVDAYRLTDKLQGGKTLICLPEQGIETEQAVRIIVKWLRDHPDQLHQTARVSAFVALAQAFSCK